MRRNWNTRLGLVLLVAGIATVAWTAVVWQWRDPFTSLYTGWQQRQLARRYDALAGRPEFAVVRGDVAAAARRFRLTVQPGDPIGRIEIARLGLDKAVVNGTDHESLEKGPGRDLRSFMPGESRLVYIAGHRTTYLAPFAEIDDLRPGDRITLEVPYGRFTYVVTGHRVVAADDLSVLRSPGREALRLQACHPRFFATQRYVVFAKPVGESTPVSAPG